LLEVTIATIIAIKYETNGKFQEIFENHKHLKTFFYKFYELDIISEIYLGALSVKPDLWS